LDDVFRAEYIAALHCTAHGDFAEGIRALLSSITYGPRGGPARRADQTERVMPPSMRMFCPVMYEEASEARKAIRSATSSAVP
ncbi:hypothetical protein ACQKI9_28310, partial [Achromobacter xylosoxidans]